MDPVNIKNLIEISQQAGHLVLSIYNQPTFEIQNKSDNSHLTQADIESHVFICASLNRLYPSIPIISEESVENFPYSLREKWDYFFLVDPLDGTKEFIQKSNEFTINIALVKGSRPILGVIHAPALGITYYAEKDKGAYKLINNEAIKLPLHCKMDDQICATISRSHNCAQTQSFLDSLSNIKTIPSGSALKFGLVAEGHADIYPRFSPTMEWDTAAGQILINEIGKEAMLVDNSGPLRYNKLHMKNQSFIVQ